MNCAQIRPSPSSFCVFPAGLALALLCLLLVALALPATAQRQSRQEAESGEVTLDFTDVELPVVIDTIARMTGRNFIYDERVRGRITIVSPTPVSADQAYAVFESVLQVKGFTTVTTPGGAIKIVPIREAKESSIETVRSSRRPPNRDHFVTRLIPLNYIDSESIVNTLKPLVSKDAAMAAYAPTNTVILTESASNIRRIIQILESIDIETYKEELSVVPVEHADAATLADQVSEIYGAEVSSTSASTSRRQTSRSRRSRNTDTSSAAGKSVPVRILTDERTNSLLVLAPRAQLEEVRGLVAKLDVPVQGGGRIHVYYLKNANAEETAQTLSGLLSGASSGATTGGTTGAAGGAAASLRSTVASLSDGISVTADPAINALIIQASQEGFNTLKNVIEQLDIERPQVLVEALIMEVDVSDARDLGVSALIRYINGDTEYAFQTATTAGLAASPIPIAADTAIPLLGFIGNDDSPSGEGGDDSGTIIQGLIRASATNGDVNILSAPHILTTDNEQAEIRIGDNIPIITSRVQSAQGQSGDGLSSSVNVERQDIGVTLRVTPQITEGDTLRMEIFQEITQINSGLIRDTGNPEEVGVPLSNRRIENTVIVSDGETVVIGGLIGDDDQQTVTKVPFLGDIPLLGWLFKSTSTTITKQNLLVFLTPHVIRSTEDLEQKTIEKREEFRKSSGEGLALRDEHLEREAARLARAEAEGIPYQPSYEGGRLRGALAAHSARYPHTRVGEIERERIEAREAAAAALSASEVLEYYLQTAIFEDPDAAATLLTELINSGHDGTVVSAQSGEAIFYEVHIGPYSTLRDARGMGAAIGRAHGLNPAVIVLEAEPE